LQAKYIVNKNCLYEKWYPLNLAFFHVYVLFSYLATISINALTYLQLKLMAKCIDQLFLNANPGVIKIHRISNNNHCQGTVSHVMFSIDVCKQNITIF